MKTLMHACFLCLLVTTGATHAGQSQPSQDGDQLTMPADNTSTVNVPGPGQTMDSVTRIWGQPAERLTAVGDPPIARWIYGGFTVYFENQGVIHSVRHQATAKTG